MNTRVNKSLEEVYFLSNMAIIELLADIRKEIGCLHKLAECASMLDMLVSFAHVSTLANYGKMTRILD